MVSLTARLSAKTSLLARKRHAQKTHKAGYLLEGKVGLQLAARTRQKSRHQTFINGPPHAGLAEAIHLPTQIFQTSASTKTDSNLLKGCTAGAPRNLDCGKSTSRRHMSILRRA
jgi:hypothetical protein